MNHLILCEGKTDAILLSYYLIHMSGWRHSNSGPRSFKISEDETRGEACSWYRRGDDFLLIAAVGSKDNFGHFYQNKIRSAQIDSDIFSKAAIVLDHDDEAIENLENKVRRDLPEIAYQATNREWILHQYQNGFEENKNISFLLQVIPPENEGALESLLLEAISEDPYDKVIVDASKNFVDEISPQAQRYIGKRRLVTKAYLGVTWAIQSPQKVFTMINDQLNQVKWETSQVLANCFAGLLEM